MKQDRLPDYFHSSSVPQTGQNGSPFLIGFLQLGHFGFAIDDNIATPTAPINRPAKSPQISSSFFPPIRNIRYEVSLKD